VKGLSWLSAYLRLTDRQEAPTSFHFWSAVAVLGHALGRKVYFMLEDFSTLYPAQVMTVLVSESAVSRKTSAMLRAIEFIEPLAHTKIVPTGTSPEGLYRSLERAQPRGEPRPDCIGLIVSEELGVFFSKARYNEGMATAVTALNDAPSGDRQRLTITHGITDLHNACVGMLAATTPTGLAHEVPDHVRTAGFMGRLVLVYEPGPRHANPGVRPVPKWTYELSQALHTDMQERMCKFSGRVQLAKDAAAWYESWYHVQFEATQKLTDDAVKHSGWPARKHAHLLRLACIMTHAEGDRQITRERAQAALALLDDVEARHKQATKEFASETEIAIADRVEQAFIRYGDWRNGGWAFVSDVSRKLHLSARQFKIVMETLQLHDRIQLKDFGARGKRAARVKLSMAQVKQCMEDGRIPTAESVREKEKDDH